MPQLAEGAQPRSGYSPARLTHNDRTVLACLERFETPMKAYDLLESLRQEGINAPMTIYRALSRLIAHGMVRKIESLNAFYAVSEDERGSFGAFLICENCKAVGFRKIARDDLRNLAPDLDITDATIELKTSCVAASDSVVSGKCART